MSKSTFDSWDYSSDRIPPTYEESIATSSRQPLPREKSTASTTASAPSMIRQERTRRVLNLVTGSIIPCFTMHLTNACNNLTIVVVPAESLQTSSTLTEQNIVYPSMQSLETTGAVIPLSGDENRPSFWTQQAVLQELDAVLRQELSGSSSAEEGLLSDFPDAKTPTESQMQQLPSTPLPARPGKKSWLKRTFVLPGTDHDPTGETGKWDLGWRSPDSSSSTGEAGTGGDGASMSRTRTKTRTLQGDEMSVHTRLQDVSFRTESVMGLLESTTVKCVWVEIEVGV